MKLTSGAFLGLLCLVLAGPASAARITIGDQGGYIDTGAIIQTWARITQNDAADHNNPSVDFFFRRMRLYMNGQYNEHIGVIFNTDVTYTAEPAPAAFTGIVTNPVTSQNAIRFSSPGFVLNEALGFYRFSKELIFMAGLQLVPWVHETTEDVTKFGSLDEQTDVTERGRPAGFLTRNRDMGIAVRGLLFNEVLNYRIGVFNGVQTAAGAVGPTASGLTVPIGGTATSVTFPAYAGVNPGDAPSFDGYIRINIIGSEPGYAFCGLCQDGKAYFNIGGGANVQPRAIAAPNRASPGATYAAYFADLVLDLPFQDNEFVLEGGWVRNVYSGNGAPLNNGTTGAALALVNNAGDGFYGHIGVRFGWLYPYFAFEDYISNLSGNNVTSTFLAFNSGLPASGRVGNLQTYHVGAKFLIAQNWCAITLDMAFQNKENAGTVLPGETEALNGNQWAGTIEFQFKI